MNKIKSIMQFVTGQQYDLKGFLYSWRLNDSNEVEVIYAVNQSLAIKSNCGMQCCYKQPFNRVPTEIEKEKALLKYITEKGIDNFPIGQQSNPNDGIRATVWKEHENIQQFNN